MKNLHIQLASIKKYSVMQTQKQTFTNRFKHFIWYLIRVGSWWRCICSTECHFRFFLCLHTGTVAVAIAAIGGLLFPGCPILLCGFDISGKPYGNFFFQIWPQRCCCIQCFFFVFFLFNTNVHRDTEILVVEGLSGLKKNTFLAIRQEFILH